LVEVRLVRPDEKRHKSDKTMHKLTYRNLTCKLHNVKTQIIFCLQIYICQNVVYKVNGADAISIWWDWIRTLLTRACGTLIKACRAGDLPNFYACATENLRCHRHAVLRFVRQCVSLCIPKTL